MHIHKNGTVKNDLLRLESRLQTGHNKQVQDIIPTWIFLREAISLSILYSVLSLLVHNNTPLHLMHEANVQ